VLLRAFQASIEHASTFRTHLRILMNNPSMFFTASSSFYTPMLCFPSPTSQIETKGVSGCVYPFHLLVIAGIFHVGRTAVEFGFQASFLNIWSLLIFAACLFSLKGNSKSKGTVHSCTGTEALYRPYGPMGE
jgi:hypothetical protein